MYRTMILRYSALYFYPRLQFFSIDHGPCGKIFRVPQIGLLPFLPSALPRSPFGEHLLVLSMADTALPDPRILLLPKIAPHLFPRAAGFKRPRRPNRVNYSIPTPRPSRLTTIGAYTPTSPLAPVEVRGACAHRELLFSSTHFLEMAELLITADDLHVRLLALRARVRALDAEIKDAEADRRLRRRLGLSLLALRTRRARVRMC
ncbi:hypothetical protein C8F04DRAFT_1070688 [Mycena alexandri]|uniref:Uncharacterized protein n=1 Tax=Mycena alexandri TaxID=1745969 RepID=A0AAD6TC66_9AGAR|nr:hypothetical protein C8F04DRAFT_1070688 [Mycena alexandri]